MIIETGNGHTIRADDADLSLLIEYTWYANRTVDGRFYAHARVPKSGGKRVSMHRLLMNPPPGMVIHHRNNNGLDNRRCNLEITTSRRNIIYAYENRRTNVHLHKQTGRWRAQVRDEAWRPVSLGVHATREAALLAVAAYRVDELQTENERLRALLTKAYQFVSPLSDPMPITNQEMAQEIMAALSSPPLETGGGK